MDADTNEQPQGSRNAQSTCNDEEFARLVVARLENKNTESQFDENDLTKPTTSPPVHSPRTSSPKAVGPESMSTHDVGVYLSFDEGKESVPEIL